MNLRRVMPAAFVTVMAVAACGTPAEPAEDAQPAGSGQPVNASPTREAASTPTTKPAAKVDACKVLSAKEITGVIGRHDGGTGDSSSIIAMCTWKNDATADQVVLLVGSAGTAPGGKLPADPSNTTTPGPDGLVFGKPDDNARFAVGDRMCSIQVLAGQAASARRATLIRLAGLVRARV
jgi:hypothetical protein